MPEFLPIQIDKSHLSTIGERLYSQSLDLIRELVANAYDADATEIKIKINDSLIVVSDNGPGMDKEGLRQYLTIGSDYKKRNPTSKKFKRTRVGEFGVGKFAVLSVCDRFEIYTRSKDYAATLIFDRQDFETRNDWNVPLIEHATKNAETGVQVSLFDIKKPLSLPDIERHLVHIFPLNDKNFSIFVNGNKLTAKYIPGERFKVDELTTYGKISGEIILSSLVLPKENVGVGIRVKGILIKRDTFNIEALHSVSVRRLTGEINADFLPITAARNEFILDTKEYTEFQKIISKKLRKVVSTLRQSAASYQDKKAEIMLSEALVTIREALKKSKDLLLLESIPLFKKERDNLPENIHDTNQPIISTSLGNYSSRQTKSQTEIDVYQTALKHIKPRLHSKVKTLFKDKNKVIKKFKVGGNEFLVSFIHLGATEKESFTEGGVIFINRDISIFNKIEKKSDLTIYHLIRLITQEIIKLTNPNDVEAAFDWQGKLIRDAFVSMKEK